MLPTIDRETEELLKILQANGQRGVALVKQVLTFARNIEGKREEVEIEKLLLEIKSLVGATFSKSIKIKMDVAPNLWSVLGDSTQLYQVLMKLVVNARDAMPQGGTLRLRAENLFVDEISAQRLIDARVGAYLMISIADTGTGIPPEIVDRIFEPFFTTKEVGKGTGLGLATVAGIVKNHGGFIQVLSRMGEGNQGSAATFWDSCFEQTQF